MEIITHKRHAFPVLRGRIEEHGYTFEELAKKLGRSRKYISERINGQRPWDLRDMTVMTDLFDAETLDELFGEDAR